MKVNTTLKYNFTANIYVPRVDRNGQEVYFLFPENVGVPVNIVSNRQTITMYTQGPTEIGSRLQEVRNPEGKLLFIEGITDSPTGQQDYDVHIWAVLPVVDIYGTITGYRSTIRRPQPELTDVKDLETQG